MPTNEQIDGLYQRSCELVLHEHGCPAIGGAGDDDCTCDAVPFLRDLRAALSAEGNAVAWPYGGCELSSGTPCNPFDCCEICQVPGAGKHAQPSTLEPVKASPERDRWAVQEYKIWKGINPDKPVWANMNLISQTWDEANGLVEYMAGNSPGKIFRVVRDRLSALPPTPEAPAHE